MVSKANDSNANDFVIPFKNATGNDATKVGMFEFRVTSEAFWADVGSSVVAFCATKDEEGDLVQGNTYPAFSVLVSCDPTT